jgi:hypothetical protein
MSQMDNLIVDSLRASSIGLLTLLNFQPNAAALPGNGTDQTMYTYTLKGGTMKAGQGVRILVAFQHTTGTASVNYRLTWGGTQVFSIPDTGTSFVETEFLIFNQPAVTNSQLEIQRPWIDATTIVRSGSANAQSKDSTVDQAIAFTFNVANTDQVTPYIWLVELIS